MTYLDAEERFDAVPLTMRDVDQHFHSYIVVHRDSPVRTIADLQGRSIAFSSSSSTSGYVMPRYYLQLEGVPVDAFFSEVRWSRTHDQTVRMVAEGEVEAGAANAQLVRDLLSRSDPPIPVRVIWQSPGFVDYTWAVRPSMSAELRRVLLGVFLGLSGSEAGRAFLASVGARFYVPASREDFDPLRAALASVQGARALR